MPNASTPSTSSTACRAGSATSRCTGSRCRAASARRACGCFSGRRWERRGRADGADLPGPVESGAVIAGSPATVRERLADRARSFRIGHLLANLQIGSMPTELTRHNIDLFSTRCCLTCGGSGRSTTGQPVVAERLAAGCVRQTSRPDRSATDMTTTSRTRRRPREGRRDVEQPDPAALRNQGSGPALVYLHPAGGLFWDEFLARLTQHYTVYAPCSRGPARTTRSPSTSWTTSSTSCSPTSRRCVPRAGERARGRPVLRRHAGRRVVGVLPEALQQGGPARSGSLWNEEHPWSLDFISAPRTAARLALQDPTADGHGRCSPTERAGEGTGPGVAGIWTFGCMAKFLWPVPDADCANGCTGSPRRP